MYVKCRHARVVRRHVLRAHIHLLYSTTQHISADDAVCASLVNESSARPSPPRPRLTRRPTPLHASLKRLKLIIDRLLVVRHSRPALLQAACVSRGVEYVSRGVGRVSRGIGSVQA
jgi:hypothetical protein